MTTAGAPLRPTRADFGPEPQNRTVVRDARFEFDGETLGRLLLHQVAAAGQVMPLAVFELDAATPDLGYRWESWNTNRNASGLYTPPAVTAPSATIVRVEYSATVPDRTGALQPLVFRGGIGGAIGGGKALVQVRPTSPLSSAFQVELFNWDGSDWADGYTGNVLVAVW